MLLHSGSKSSPRSASRGGWRGASGSFPSRPGSLLKGALRPVARSPPVRVAGGRCSVCAAANGIRHSNFVGANRSSLFVFSDDLNTITNTHEWVASEADSQIDLLQGIPFETFGHHAKSLLKHEIIAISKIVDYPPEAEAELAWVKEYGFRSMLFVPLTSEGKLFGTLGFYGEVGDTIIWSNLFLQLLTVIGDIFVNTFSRQKSDEILANRIQEMERFNRMAVGREHRMVELKRQVNEYAARLGEEPLFDISFTGD